MLKFFFFILIAILFSCSKYQKLLKSDDLQLKKEKAFEYYEKGDYYRAIQLLEGLVIAFRGTSQSEKIYYYYGYAHYNMGDYLLAAYHFKNLAQTLPNSQYAEESLFMSAYCKYLYSPDYFLDQTNTTQAIKEFQFFINRYPLSDTVSKCNEYIDEMRNKLELKSFERAGLYFKMEEFKAAITSFNNHLKEYPGSKFTEEALFFILKSWFLYAQGSALAKQDERYEKSTEAYYIFIERFPNTKYESEANMMLKRAQKH